IRDKDGPLKNGPGVALFHIVCSTILCKGYRLDVRFETDYFTVFLLFRSAILFAIKALAA
ncbi:hypothetical protein Ancab_017026, partial [Ancistrocladus abbreviatus]